MGETVRPAGQVAHRTCRWISQKGVQVGLTTTAPTTVTNGLNDPTIAHGLTGSEDCVLSVETTSGFTSGGVTITCYIWSRFTGEWVTAGAPSTRNTITFSPGQLDVFTIPENSLFYLVGGSASSAGTVAVDGTNPAGRPGL